MQMILLEIPLTTLEPVALIFSWALLAYICIGLLFAVAFSIKGIQTVDHAAKGGSFWFRFLIFPGTVALWPILLRKWIKARQ